jgi:hypothetical protein
MIVLPRKIGVAGNGPGRTPEMIHELREAGADLHHRLHERDMQGKADVAVHALGCAREAGVPEEVCAELVTEVFRTIITEIPRKQRKGGWSRRLSFPRPSALRDLGRLSSGDVQRSTAPKRIDTACLPQGGARCSDGALAVDRANPDEPTPEPTA